MTRHVRCRLPWRVAVISFLSPSLSPAIPQVPAQADLEKTVSDEMVLTNYTRAGKPALVAKYLEHELISMRFSAVTSLRSMGLPQDLVGKYQAAELFGDSAKLAEAVAPIRDWANAAPSSPEPVKDVATRTQAIEAVIGGWRWFITYWKRPDDYAHLFARSLPDFIPKLTDDKDKRYVTIYVLSVLDADDLLAEIGMPKDLELKKDAVDQWLPQIGQWLANNHTYFYFHPKERTLKLDFVARSAGVPSKAYRTANPWGPNEGPNVTDPTKKVSPILPDEQ